MVYLCLILLSFLLLLEVLSGKRIALLPFLMILFLVLLMSANTKNPDFVSYAIQYERQMATNDWLYGKLSEIFYIIGLPYYALRLFMSVIGFLLIHSTVKTFVQKQSVFYLLYFLYPFFFDVVQIRNFLGMAILIYSIRYLIDITPLSGMKYLVCIIVAFGFQASFLLYIPLLLIPLVNRSILLKGISLTAVVFALFVTINRPLLNSTSQLLLGSLSSFDSRIDTYITQSKGLFIQWIIQLINLISIQWSKRLLQRSYRKRPNEFEIILDRNRKLVDLVLMINIYLLVFSPLYIINSNFARLYRNVIPLNYICYLSVYASKNLNSYASQNYEKLIFQVVSISYIISLFVVRVLTDYYETIFLAILQYNWFFG